MLDFLTGGLIDAAIPLLRDTLVTLFMALFGMMIWAARQYLGASAARTLQEALDEAIDRSIAQNGHEQTSTQQTVDYILSTMGGTVKQLGASPDGLRRRVQAQQAQHREFHGYGQNAKAN